MDEICLRDLEGLKRATNGVYPKFFARLNSLKSEPRSTSESEVDYSNSPSGFLFRAVRNDGTLIRITNIVANPDDPTVHWMIRSISNRLFVSNCSEAALRFMIIWKNKKLFQSSAPKIDSPITEKEFETSK